jgi:hypothetical protein
VSRVSCAAVITLASGIVVFGRAGAGCTPFARTSAAPPSEAEAGAPSSAAGSGADASDDPSSLGNGLTKALAYRAMVLADAPVAYWSFEEDAAATVLADNVSGRLATVFGPLKRGVAAAFGRGLEFGVEEAYAEVGDFFDLPGRAAFTVEAWVAVRLENEYSNIVFRGRDSDHSWAFFIHREASSGVAVFTQLGSSATREVSAPIDLATLFVHVAATFDGRIQVLYVGGVPTSGAVVDVGALGGPPPFVIGQGFRGLIDELAVYDHALSQERIAAHVAAGH